MSTGEQTAADGNEAVTISETSPGAGPPQELRIELPPLPAPKMAPPVNPHRGRTLDGILCLLLLVFAFLCGSFKAYNTDLFQHLATGRLIAEGKYTFGSDPFSFASTGSWINHAWLYDVLAYGLFMIGSGGVVLVVVNALAIVVLAGVMLRTASIPGQRLWLPIVCTILGVLALSPRLWVQPTIASMLLLAVTLFLLTRSAERPGRLWFLPVICLLWVNLDAWFLLGPITIAAYLVGQWVPPLPGEGGTAGPATPSKVAPGTLGLVLLVSLAACLCNPYHVRAFAELPTGLVRLGAFQALANENTFRGSFLSPFLDSRFYFYDTIGLSAAGLAYFLLLGVSLISFVAVGIVYRSAFRWDWLFVWLVFVLLGGLHLRAIPFFAIVAAPIASLNFFALLRRPVPVELPSKNLWDAWAIPGRVFTLLALFALCVGSISGILQAQPHFRRQVGWGVEEDKALAGAVRHIKKWQEEGLVPPGQNWMSLSPEALNYLAWYAPGEKGFVDQRLSLFGDAGDDFVALRKAFDGEQPAVEAGIEPPPPAWRKIFRDRKIQFFLFHTRDITRASAPLVMFYGNPAEFIPCYVEGSTAIFAWRDPQEKSAGPIDRRLAIDFGKRAFGMPAETAPSTPGRVTGSLPWWWPILRPEASSPPEGALGFQYSTRFDALSFEYRRDAQLRWVAASCTSLLGLAASPSGPLPGGILLRARLVTTYDAIIRSQANRTEILDRVAITDLNAYTARQDKGPPSALYLAIRACRRSLATNPDDTLSQLVLAEAYSRLTSRTNEHFCYMVQNPKGEEQVLFRPVQMIRQTQIATALRNVLKVNPRQDRAQLAHMLLFEVFREPEYMEPRVYHLRKYLELSKAQRSLVRVPRALFDQEIKSLETGVKELERQLKSKRDQYEVNAGNKPLMQKVSIAISNGLAETALNLLLKASSEELRGSKNQREAPGATLAIMLLLGLGRVDEVKDALTPEVGSEDKFDPRAFGKHPLGMPAYEWFQVQKAAAIGDYAAADHYLEECILKLRDRHPNADLLDQLGIVPRKHFKKNPHESIVAGALLGEFLLREAHRSTNRAWYWQLASLVSYRADAKRWLFQSPHLERFYYGRAYLFSNLAQEANLMTLRAWLALEQGSNDKARKHAQQTMHWASLPGYDPQIIQQFTSIPLAAWILDLTKTTRDRK